jgi:hypothetical protein
MLNIALAIHAGETRYNIVRMSPYESSNLQPSDDQQDSQISTFNTHEYRIFSQVR